MKRTLAASLLLVGLMSASCATRATFRTSQIAPAAEGRVKVTKDSHGNAKIWLKVNHLTPPERLAGQKLFYVVWVETPQGRTINLGQLTVDDRLSAEFNGVTPLHEFRLLITAEDLAAAGNPSRDVVLTTEMLEL